MGLVVRRCPPVLSEEVVEGQEDVPVLREAAACGLVHRTVFLQEVKNSPVSCTSATTEVDPICWTVRGWLKV